MNYLDYLSGEDRKSVQGVSEVLADILENPEKIEILYDIIRKNENIVIRSKGSNAIYKISESNPEIINNSKSFLLNEMYQIEQTEVLWHYCSTLANINLSQNEIKQHFEICEEFFNRDNKFLKVFSLEAQFAMALQDEDYLDRIIKKLNTFSVHGPASLRARCRKLLKSLEKRDKKSL